MDGRDFSHRERWEQSRPFVLPGGATTSSRLACGDSPAANRKLGGPVLAPLEQ